MAHAKRPSPQGRQKDIAEKSPQQQGKEGTTVGKLCSKAMRLCVGFYESSCNDKKSGTGNQDQSEVDAAKKMAELHRYAGISSISSKLRALEMISSRYFSINFCGPEALMVTSARSCFSRGFSKERL